MITEQEERLNEVIRPAAERYAMLEEMDRNLPEVRAEQRGIARMAVEWNSIEVAYFCQQLISRLSSHQLASDCLTVFTNRMSRGL